MAAATPEATGARHCWQHTLATPVSLQGVGLHRGRPQRMKLSPSAADTGVTFVRTDLPGQPSIAATPNHVVDTRLCTTLASQRGGATVRVQTVEHVLSALFGAGIDNVRVELDGEEVPVLDGSALPIVEAVRRVGRRRQPRLRQVLYVRAPIEVRDGDRRAVLRPPPPGRHHLQVRCQLSFDHPLIPTATYRYRHSATAYRRQLAPARTFGFVRDIEALRVHGLTLGGSLDNAVVFDVDSVCNPGGLRFDDECARHKVLDALGDLYLLGCAVIGELELVRSGHGLHVALAQALLARTQDTTRVPLAQRIGRHACVSGSAAVGGFNDDFVVRAP